MLHFIVCVDHVIFCLLDIVTELSNACVLTLDSCVKVLGFVLGGLDYTNDFVELIILVTDHFLLMLKNLTIVQITSLVILVIITTLILNLLLLSSKCCLVAFHSTIVLSQLPSNEFFNLVN